MIEPALRSYAVDDDIRVNVLIEAYRRIPDVESDTGFPCDLPQPALQDLKVTGQRFGAGLKAIVTDPMGMEVLDPVIKDLTPTSFTLNVRLEAAGSYNLVLSTGAGATSSIATIVVK